MIPESWETNEVSHKTINNQAVAQEWGINENPGRLRGGIKIMGRTRELEFAEQYSREERTPDKKNYGEP